MLNDDLSRLGKAIAALRLAFRNWRDSWSHDDGSVHSLFLVDQLPPVTVRVPMPRVKPPRVCCDECGGWASSYPHWNSPDVLPPVGCPIVLRIGCAAVQAERTAHIERRDREMTYKLPTGQELVGRYPWTYR